MITPSPPMPKYLSQSAVICSGVRSISSSRSSIITKSLPMPLSFAKSYLMFEQPLQSRLSHVVQVYQ